MSANKQFWEGRIPMWYRVLRQRGGRKETIACETFDAGDLVELHLPPHICRAVSAFALCSILLGLSVILADWADYRDTFRLRRRS